MLPTFLFILGAYAFYAVLTFWSRRSSRRWRSVREPRTNWLALTAGLGAVVCLACLVVKGGPESPDMSLRLAGIVGTGNVEAGLAVHPEYRLEQPPEKAPGPGGQPAFALLHPETPTSLILPEKTASTLKARKPKAKSRPGPAPEKKGKAAKALAKDKPPAKEKIAAKSRPKARKSAPAAAKPAQQVQASAR